MLICSEDVLSMGSMSVGGVSPCDDDGAAAGAVVMVLRRLRGLHVPTVGYSELMRVYSITAPSLELSRAHQGNDYGRSRASRLLSRGSTIGHARLLYLLGPTSLHLSALRPQSTAK